MPCLSEKVLPFRSAYVNMQNISLPRSDYFVLNRPEILSEFSGGTAVRTLTLRLSLTIHIFHKKLVYKKLVLRWPKC